MLSYQSEIENELLGRGLRTATPMWGWAPRPPRPRLRRERSAEQLLLCMPLLRSSTIDDLSQMGWLPFHRWWFALALLL